MTEGTEPAQFTPCTKILQINVSRTRCCGFLRKLQSGNKMEAAMAFCREKTIGRAAAEAGTSAGDETGARWCKLPCRRLPAHSESINWKLTRQHFFEMTKNFPSILHYNNVRLSCFFLSFSWPLGTSLRRVVPGRVLLVLKMDADVN